MLRRVARTGGADALLPVIALHLDSYLYYLENNSRALMRHSRTITAAAIDLYAASSDAASTSHRASWLLTRLAGKLLHTRTRGGAGDLLEQAIVLSPGNTRARFGLAAILEKEGRYPDVIALLSPTRPEPSDGPEIWLRLAINLSRL